MNKELIDRAWQCLPREFKEEVKYKYNKTKTKKIKKECDLGFLNAHEGMFGVHNLTSDAEGEEMLIVPRSHVQKYYANFLRESKDATSSIDRLSYGGRRAMLQELFGSKCLPDEEPKPAEPKYHVGDKVLVKMDDDESEIATIVYYDTKDDTYRIEFMRDDAEGSLWLTESDLEPYTEPTANYMHSEGDLNTAVLTGKCSSASTCDKQFDTIVKDSFRNERRLNIAARIVASMVGSDDWTTWRGGSDKEIWHNMAKSSLEIADALIAECEKKGDSK